MIVCITAQGIAHYRFRTSEAAAEFCDSNANRIDFAIENKAMAGGYYWCYQKDVVGEDCEDVPIYGEEENYTIPEEEEMPIVQNSKRKQESISIEDEMAEELDPKKEIKMPEPEPEAEDYEGPQEETESDIYIMVPNEQVNSLVKIGSDIHIDIEGYGPLKFVGVLQLENSDRIVARSIDK